MATTTANLGLAKPEYSDTADVQDINQNMDKIDGAVSAAQNSFAILADGNTHAAILSGQFVYVRNHSSLADGLYSATATIPANGALSTSNLTAVSDGGLNELKSKFNGYVKYTEVSLPSTFVGTEWGPVARSLGTVYNAFAINANQIVSIAIKNAGFNTGAMPFAAIYNGELYVGATISATLVSTQIVFLVGYHD